MHLLWVFFFLQALVVFPTVLVNAAGTVFVKPQVRITTTFTNFHARIMDHWGGGGGEFDWISLYSNHPFKGRTFGGAKRKEIRGTRAFGSGYPYGAGNQSTVAGRPFPFGVWPLYWDQNFMNSSEYGPQYDAIRPGGFLTYVPLRTTQPYFNVTDSEIYYAIGDRDSLLFIMISYVTSCHVAPTWPSRFDPTSTNSTVKLENVIQYFRASSFALVSPAYNNTFAHTSNSETKDSTPLPDFIEHSPFRECIGDVTENALAIMSKPPKTVFPDYLIVVFVFLGGGMFGLAVTILIYTCLLVFAIKRCLWSGPFAYLSELLDQLFEMKKRKQEARRRQTEAIAGERRQEFVYERYP